jgi:hypothetical protein
VADERRHAVTTTDVPHVVRRPWCVSSPAPIVHNISCPLLNRKLKNFGSLRGMLSLNQVFRNFDPNMTLWHYTNGNGFLGMLESGSIRATQVASVNDSTETVYATRLYRQAINKLKQEKAEDQLSQNFLQGVLDEIEASELPGHSDSKFFLACFTELEDDTNQWLKYGSERAEGGSEEWAVKRKVV